MKAALATKRGAPLEIRDDVRLAELAPGHVHVKLAASGVCHTDLSVQNGTIPSPFPCVLGHEGAGVVLAVGDGVTEVAAGDHVILCSLPACGRCKPCLRGQASLCTATAEMQQPRFVVDERPVNGFAGAGTFAEEAIYPQSAVVRSR